VTSLSKAPRHAGGVVVITGPEGIVEEDAFVCQHCSRMITRPGGVSMDEVSGGCGVCGKIICLPCVNVGTCTPFEKRLERMEARGRFLRSAGLGG
jgi:hypothetical protein